MLSDVTLQFHISYFCQDNDGGSLCQSMISDNSRRSCEGGGWGDKGRFIVVWCRGESVKSVILLWIVTSDVTVHFTAMLLGNWRHLHILTNCLGLKYLWFVSTLSISNTHADTHTQTHRNPHTHTPTPTRQGSLWNVFAQNDCMWCFLELGVFRPCGQDVNRLLMLGQF